MAVLNYETVYFNSLGKLDELGQLYCFGCFVISGELGEL